MKAVLKSIGISLIISTAIFCVMCIFFDIYFKGEFALSGYRMSKMLLGVVLTGIGFGAPTFIYQRESVPMALRAVFHLGIGFTVYLIAGIIAGWIPTSLGAGTFLAIAAGQLAVAFLIWLGFYIYNRNLAKKINRKIKER